MWCTAADTAEELSGNKQRYGQVHCKLRHVRAHSTWHVLHAQEHPCQSNSVSRIPTELAAKSCM